MRKSLKVAVLSLILLALVSSASASTITLNSSSCTGSTSSCINGELAYLGMSGMPLKEQGPNPTLALSASPSVPGATNLRSYDTAQGGWDATVAGTSWVTNTLTSGAACSGSQCDADGFYYYETTFSAVGGAAGSYSGTISVMADDTAEVLLNGVVIVPFGALGADGHCSLNEPNCNVIDTVSLSGILLNAGTDTNTLEIIDAQTDLGGAGVDFSAKLSTAPEPSSLLLLGTGLLGLAYGLLRTNKASGVVLNS